jgi:hypothetical protein
MENQAGDRCAELDLLDPWTNHTLKAWACESVFGDLRQLAALVGSEVNLHNIGGSLYLKPIVDQQTRVAGERDHDETWDGDEESLFFPLEEELYTDVSLQKPDLDGVLRIATSLARLSREQCSPALLWLHVP